MSDLLYRNQGLIDLIEANRPYWAAEAEIIREYWSWSGRSKETDRKWIVHQMYKEFWDGVIHYSDLFRDSSRAPSTQDQRLLLHRLASTLVEEVEHFSSFADLMSSLEPGFSGMEPDHLQRIGSWRENDELIQMRRSQIEAFPDLGRRASKFTEGGYVALFREGMNIPIKSDFDRAISGVCGAILEEEFLHMLHGIVGMSSDDVDGPEWELLKHFSTEQMKARLHMRHAQFSRPICSQRFSELLDGKAEPIEFDYDKANSILLANASHISE